MSQAKSLSPSASSAAIIGTLNDTSEFRRGVYTQLVREEIAKARAKHGERLSGQQRAGAKGNATKRFFAMGF